MVLSLRPKPVIGRRGYASFLWGVAWGCLGNGGRIGAGKEIFLPGLCPQCGGIAYGSESSFRTAQAKFQQGGCPEEFVPGWWNSRWLGPIYRSGQSAWVMHPDLGWLFPMESPCRESGCGEAGWAGFGRMPNIIRSSTKTIPGLVVLLRHEAGSVLFYRYRDSRWLAESRGGR